MNGQLRLSTIGLPPAQEYRRSAFLWPALRYLRRLFALLRFWCDRSRQRRHLAALDDRLLADIGKSRREARQEIAKPFWR